MVWQQVIKEEKNKQTSHNEGLAHMLCHNNAYAY